MEPNPPDPSSLLQQPFFERDPRIAARELLGCVLLSRKGSVMTGGRIVETEAYLGFEDAGSHAATKGVTRRNAVMYGPPGHAYVYFTYGNHYLLNFVCEPEGTAGATLVRALEPLYGIAVMKLRRRGRPIQELTNGPGKLAVALAVDLTDNACPLNEKEIFVYEAPCSPKERIAVSGRVGLTDGHEHQYRYYLLDNPFVSRGRTGPVRRPDFAKDRSRP